MLGKTWIVIIGCGLLAGGAVLALMSMTDDNDRSDENTRDGGVASPTGSVRSHASMSAGRSPAGMLLDAPVTGDPRELGRWIGEVVFGIDYREDREHYVDALWAVSIGADAVDADTAWAAFAEDPALAGIVELIPEPEVWGRLAAHEQWAVFDVREPIGAEEVELDPALTRAGVITTMVLVTGTQTMHYTGGDGSAQTQLIRPSLEMLIGCAAEWSGCRLLRVLDRQP
ncbi:hypothetical protein [Phytoactinopolyspora limicola]|uniref:hypothetical protein n=1 Tax=Phytoactinopolyspora limicola TaxID=2715536 RepID=UPI00140C521A|nr:hypothetical protein [Phytoactinopolyspora limicola]